MCLAVKGELSLKHLRQTLNFTFLCPVTFVAHNHFAVLFLRGARVAQWENTRLSPMWSGFKSRRRAHMMVEFKLLLVLSLAPRGFSPVFWFSPLLKIQHDPIPARTRLNELSSKWVNKYAIYTITISSSCCVSSLLLAWVNAYL